MSLFAMLDGKLSQGTRQIARHPVLERGEASSFGGRQVGPRPAGIPFSAVPFVYILRCGDGSLYTGAAVDLARRLREHQAGKASRYTRSRLPVEFTWSAEVETWSDALREERRIKRLRRLKKEELIARGDAAKG